MNNKEAATAGERVQNDAACPSKAQELPVAPKIKRTNNTIICCLVSWIALKRFEKNETDTRHPIAYRDPVWAPAALET